MTSDGDFAAGTVINNLAQVVGITMNSTAFSDGLFLSALMIAFGTAWTALSSKMVGWGLQKRSVVRTNDYTRCSVVDILELRIIISVAEYSTSLFDELFDRASVPFACFDDAALRTASSTDMFVSDLLETTVYRADDGYLVAGSSINRLAVIVLVVMNFPTTAEKVL